MLVPCRHGRTVPRWSAHSPRPGLTPQRPGLAHASPATKSPDTVISTGSRSAWQRRGTHAQAPQRRSQAPEGKHDRLLTHFFVLHAARQDSAHVGVTSENFWGVLNFGQSLAGQKRKLPTRPTRGRIHGCNLGPISIYQKDTWFSGNLFMITCLSFFFTGFLLVSSPVPLSSLIIIHSLSFIISPSMPFFYCLSIMMIIIIHSFSFLLITFLSCYLSRE